MTALRVVVASNRPEVLSFVVTLLRNAGHQAAAYAPDKPLPYTPDVVVRDAYGVRRNLLQDCPTVLMSGSWTTDWLRAARESGAVCLSKPFTRA
jgi:hypothetical protein